MEEPIIRLYVDTETTGLDPFKHEVIEVAVVTEEVPYPYNRPGTITNLWCQKILPEHIENAEAKALEVNGYTPEAWSEAVPFKEVIPTLLSLFDGKSAWIGHNPQFDRAFIVESMKRLGFDTGMTGRHRMIDTTALAYMAWGLDGKLRLSMDSLRKHLGLPEEGAHGALPDALVCRKVFYRALETRFSPLDG